MSRKRKPTGPEIATRLTIIKRLVAGMKDAMPTMAAELRREACESLDDLVSELT